MIRIKIGIEDVIIRNKNDERMDDRIKKDGRKEESLSIIENKEKFRRG